ncbi:MAG: hypothetical protein RRA15_06330 [bacterium]|nr:hypothetical protein [bacterium]MDT8366092.1 hypothetical protein [bacterium]
MKTILSLLSSPRFLAALVAVLLVLSFIPTANGPALEVIFSNSGLGKVSEAAEMHLEQQREQALKGFLLLSALKVGLAVLKSSEVGFILNVKVGDLAVAVYDYVDFGWKVLLAAVAYYYIAEYLLDLAAVVNIWFLWAALVCALAWLLIRDVAPDNSPFRSAFARSSVVASVLALLLYIGLPLSVVGAGWVSDHITGEPISEANSLYEDMGQTMPSLLEGDGQEETEAVSSGIQTSTVTVPVPYDGTDPALALTERPEGSGGNILTALVSGEKIREFKKYIQKRSKALASAVLRQTAAYIFNIAVFPLLMIAALYLVSRYLMGLMGIK